MDELKQLIIDCIGPNGQGEITGQLLQEVLLKITDAIPEVPEPEVPEPEVPGLTLTETTEAPTGLPEKTSILLNTTENIVYFGLAEKGWWAAPVQNINGKIEVQGNALYIENFGIAENQTLLLKKGSVTNNVLTL